MYKYVLAIPFGALPADSVALRETAEAVQIAEQAGDDFTLGLARVTRGLVLVHHLGPHREEGFNLLTQAREAARRAGFTMNALAVVDLEIAGQQAENANLDGAIELSRSAIADMHETGAVLSLGIATKVLVETLLDRSADGDLEEAQAAIDRLAAVPTEPGFLLHELPLLWLRARMAQVHGDDAAGRQFIQDYRAKAAAAGFEPLVRMADAG
jgi:hypothetical protein